MDGDCQEVLKEVQESVILGVVMWPGSIREALGYKAGWGILCCNEGKWMSCWRS